MEFDVPLDDYIEAHVHGTVDIASDVEALVLDPSYRHTPFDEIARSLASPVLWHDGYKVDVEEIAHHPDYRGRTSLTWPETSHTRASSLHPSSVVHGVSTSIRRI